MFVKREVKRTLVEKYEEANKVEVELDSINKHTAELKAKTFNGKKTFVVNQT